MNLIDSLIILGFFSLTFYIGYSSNRKSNSESDYFLGGRNLPWWALSLSLVATETSTLTFLGIPALSYSGDFSFLSLAIGLVIGRVISAVFILPQYMTGNFLSIYQWVGLKFGTSSQITLSLLFSIIRILSDGVRLYAASLPLSFMIVHYFPSNWSFQEISILSLVILSTATILYSAYGGFRAVVWTDFLQFIVYCLGGVIVIVLLSLDFGSITNLISKNPDKWKIFHFTFTNTKGELDPYYFLFSIPGGILLALGSHGTDQMLVQRLLACKNLNESRLALIFSGFVVLLQFVIFLTIGAYLVYALPSVPTPNRVFSDYIVNILNTPWKGVILAGVFASSMSTLSSTLNSLTLTTQVDMKLRFKSSSSPIWITIIWGIMLLVSSLIPFILDETTKNSIVELGLSFASYVFGPMVALFFLEVFPLPERKKFHSSFFPLVLAFSIALTFLGKVYFAMPFTWIVAYGILNFYSLYILGFGITLISLRSKKGN